MPHFRVEACDVKQGCGVHSDEGVDRQQLILPAGAAEAMFIAEA